VIKRLLGMMTAGSRDDRGPLVRIDERGPLVRIDERGPLVRIVDRRPLACIDDRGHLARYNFELITSIASCDVLTGITSKSTRSFQFSIQIANNDSSSVFIS
jgi:hypothetical protein